MAQVYMLEDFVAEEEGELSAVKDEILNVLEPDADGWTYVQNMNGEVGLVPSGFTVPIEQETEEIEEYKETEEYQNYEAESDMNTTETGQKNEPEEQEEEVVDFRPPPIPIHPLDSTESKKDIKKKKRTSSISKVATILSPRKATQDHKSVKESVTISISQPSHPSGHPPSIVQPVTPKSPRKAETNLIQLTPVILRVFTNEEIHREIEEKDLGNDRILRTFKSIRATGQTPVRQIIDDVAKKLLLPDSRQFHLFIIDRKGKEKTNYTRNIFKKSRFPLLEIYLYNFLVIFF